MKTFYSLLLAACVLFLLTGSCVGIAKPVPEFIAFNLKSDPESWRLTINDKYDNPYRKTEAEVKTLLIEYINKSGSYTDRQFGTSMLIALIVLGFALLGYLRERYISKRKPA